MSYTLWKFGSPESDPAVCIGDNKGLWLHTLGDPEDPLDTMGVAYAAQPSVSGSIWDGHGPQRSPVLPVEVTKKGLLVATTQLGLHDNFIWVRAQRGRRSTLWRLVRKFEGPPGANPPIQFMPARCTAVNSGISRKIENAYALPVEIKFVLLGRCWSGARTGNLETDSEGTTLEIWGETELNNDGLENSISYTNGGNANVTNAIITVTAGGDDVTAVHLALNTCSWTYTGTITAGASLVIDCGARSILNNGIADYGNFALDASHRSHEWLILEPGTNTIVYTIQTKNQGSTPPPTLNLTFYDGWE